MIVYILINEAMPGLVKIGRTENLAQRMVSLDTSGVPLPFQCYYAARVQDAVFVESRLHVAFGDFRLRAKREFFKLDPLRAKAALEIAAIEDVTPRDDIVADTDDRSSLARAQSRAPNFRFSLAEIPVGSVLTFAKDPKFTATVSSDKKIVFENVEHSTTAAASEIMKRLGFNWSAIQGPQYWLFEGETLAERRARIESEQGEEGP